VFWHDMSLPKEQGSHSSPQNSRLIGEDPAKPICDNEIVEKPPINKTLAGPIFWHTDAEYLDEIEITLRHRDKVLADTLDDYWLRLVRDYRSGKKMLKQITEADWQQRERSGNWHVPFSFINGTGIKCEQKRVLASPKHPDGHIWALRLMRQELINSDDTKCLQAKRLQQHPAVMGAFLASNTQTPLTHLQSTSTLSPAQYAQLSAKKLYLRFLGVLTHCDMAIAMALLIREHANLTPDSLAGAKLLNSYGKSYLLITDVGKPEIFSVDKPRARTRKRVALTPRARRVIRHILLATAPVRALLQRANHPHWRYLFLGYITENSSTKLGHPTRINPRLLHDFHGSYTPTLVKLYPALTDANLRSNTLNFAKIRNTQGVLAWFEKGSVRAIARRMGNTQKVCIQHYIPEVLIDAWNERIIRRFQNTLLLLAAHDEDWLLDVVDMPNLAELHRFIAQQVYELPAGRSPIADQMQQDFGARFRIDQAEPPTEDAQGTKGQLHLRLSTNSLALLLGYRQWAQKHLSPTVQAQPDRETGLTPRHFIDLAGMLQVAAQNKEVGDELRESLDIAKLQRCYTHASDLVSDWAARIDQFSLQNIIEEPADDS